MYLKTHLFFDSLKRIERQIIEHNYKFGLDTEQYNSILKQLYKVEERLEALAAKQQG